MKKVFLPLVFFSLFFCCNTYADDSLNNNEISELFPEPPGVSERAIRFAPDPDVSVNLKMYLLWSYESANL